MLFFPETTTSFDVPAIVIQTSEDITVPFPVTTTLLFVELMVEETICPTPRMSFVADAFPGATFDSIPTAGHIQWIFPESVLRNRADKH